MLERITDIICEYVDIDPALITEASNLRTDIGATSFDLMNIAMALENEYKVSLPNSELPRVKTVGDIIALLSK
ncbi:MAG: acyl carrier protein [Clostridia bacterium]|nr:acyl carrier protein [Clostridia bacterium]